MYLDNQNQLQVNAAAGAGTGDEQQPGQPANMAAPSSLDQMQENQTTQLDSLYRDASTAGAPEDDQSQMLH